MALHNKMCQPRNALPKDRPVSDVGSLTASPQNIYIFDIDKALKLFLRTCPREPHPPAATA